MGGSELENEWGTMIKKEDKIKTPKLLANIECTI